MLYLATLWGWLMIKTIIGALIIYCLYVLYKELKKLGKVSDKEEELQDIKREGKTVDIDRKIADETIRQASVSNQINEDLKEKV